MKMNNSKQKQPESKKNVKVKIYHRLSQMAIEYTIA